MGSVAWLFPGQGSQAVGMSRDLAERYPSAMRAFDEASGIDDPVIWTAERDRQMWAALQGG